MLEKIKGGLVVSCQALPDEPLHSSFIMGRMALAAKQGGAVGIRAQSKEDIMEIKKTVDLPVIGIVKRNYPDSDIYITPTKKEIDELLETKCEMIALDATLRDEKIGFDCVSTTLCGYTPYSVLVDGPNIPLLKKLVAELHTPILAEGKINTPEDLAAVYEAGVHSAVVGGAITRPKQITERFVKVLK